MSRCAISFILPPPYLFLSYISSSPRVFDEKPIKAGIGNSGGPSTFEELLERELRSQPRSTQSKSGAQTSSSGKCIPPRATTPTGSKKFDKLKLVNRSVSTGNVLVPGPPSGSAGAQFAAGRSVSSTQFPPAHLSHSTTSALMTRMSGRFEELTVGEDRASVHIRGALARMVSLHADSRLRVHCSPRAKKSTWRKKQRRWQMG